jgi:hypothetical protein
MGEDGDDSYETIKFDFGPSQRKLRRINQHTLRQQDQFTDQPHRLGRVRLGQRGFGLFHFWTKVAVLEIELNDGNWTLRGIVTAAEFAWVKRLTTGDAVEVCYHTATKTWSATPWRRHGLDRAPGGMKKLARQLA